MGHHIIMISLFRFICHRKLRGTSEFTSLKVAMIHRAVEIRTGRASHSMKSSLLF